MSSKGKRVIFLAILLIAFFPNPIHTTTWPFNSIGAHFVSSGSSMPELCFEQEERWSGLLVGIQVNRVHGHGETDCVEMYKEWGIDIRCRHGRGWVEKENWMAWGIPAGENAVVIGLGILPLKAWSIDAFSLKLISIRIASSGVGINPIGKYHYPNLVMFGECDNQLQ